MDHPRNTPPSYGDVESWTDARVAKLVSVHCIRIRPGPIEIQLRSAGVELGRWPPFLTHVTVQACPLAMGQPAGMSMVLAMVAASSSSCCQHRPSPRADAVTADRTNLDEHDLQARGSLFLHRRRLPSCGLSLLWALPLCATMRTMHLFGQDDKQLPGSHREPGIGLGKMHVSLF